MEKLFLVFLFITLNSLMAQKFEVKVDTLYLDLKKICKPASKVRLTHAVKFKDKYYCFFNEDNLYYFKQEKKHFIEFSENGKVLNNIEVPNEIQNTIYFDFFIRNDSLLSKIYMDHNSFYFDFAKLEWIKIKEVDDEVYVDKDFKIAYLDFGEWGNSTWFIDKKTNKEYVSGNIGTIINKLNDKYILTNGVQVIEIHDPHSLKECELNYYYNLVEKANKFHEGSPSLIGSKEIYKDTAYNPWSFKEPNKLINTSFVFKNQLYHLVTDTISTYVAQIQNGNLIQVQNLNEKYSIFNMYYSYRGNNLENDSRFLKFEENNNTFGFIEIKGSKIDINYVKHNIDSLKFIGNDNFDKILAIIKNKQSKLTIEEIETAESLIGGIDLKTDRSNLSHNGFYPIRYESKQIRLKEFVKVINEEIAQTTEYLYTTDDNKIRSIFIEWTPTETYNELNVEHVLKKYKFQKSNEVKQVFSKKTDEIIEIITKTLKKKPIKNKVKDENIDLTWKLENYLECKLYKRNDEIRIIINLED